MSGTSSSKSGSRAVRGDSAPELVPVLGATAVVVVVSALDSALSVGFSEIFSDISANGWERLDGGELEG